LDKAPGAFRTISEVADEIDVPQHVLRFWESRFAQIRPMKRGGGRRFYRPEDVDLLRGVRHLLYGEGYTIRGVQRILREQGAAFVQNVWRIGAEPPPPESEQDRAGDEADAPAAGERSEPDLSLFSFASSRTRTGEDRPGERREPTFAPAPPGMEAQPAGLSGEERRKLRTALDELVACHRLIEAALSQAEPPERVRGDPGPSATD
jgi:DNA-binding transcriptional MerR regulator